MYEAARAGQLGVCFFLWDRSPAVAKTTRVKNSNG
jgi:hypothetical protein